MINKIILISIIISAALFTGCEGTTGGAPANTDDGLSSDYYIKSITFSSGTLKYPFNSDDWINYLEVPYDIDSLTVTVTANHTWAGIYIGTEKLENDIPSNPISLKTGINNLLIKVIAENKNELIYTIYITRLSKNYTNATLSELVINGITLTPLFHASGKNRNFFARTTEPKIAVFTKASAESEGATVELLVNNVKNENPLTTTLQAGVNTLKIISTAPDGKTKETYTITVVLQNQSVDSSALMYLSIAGGNFKEDFDPSVTTYSLDVTSSMNPVNLTAITVSDQATIRIETGDTAVSDPSSIPLPQGIVSIINVIVTAGNGSTTTYTINANSLMGSDNANLSGLTVMMGTKSYRPLYPGTFNHDSNYHDPGTTGFSKEQIEYATVLYGFDSAKVTATADDRTVKAIKFIADGSEISSELSDGVGSAIIPLNYGLVTRIDITVLAGNNETQKIYTVYAKLLNIDEFYWGIYGPSLDKSKSNRWEPKPSAGGSKSVSGLISGSMKWSITLSPTSTIALANYNDGKQGFNYNDNGFITNGTQEAKLDGVATKDGYNCTKPGTVFYVRTAEGENVATLNYHIKIDGGETVEGSDSYTDITYMGVTNRQIFRTSKPYPFSSSFDWNSNWIDGQ